MPPAGQPTVLIGSLDELVQQLGREQIPHQRATGAPVVTIPTKLGDEDDVLHIRWGSPEGVVQFIQNLPISLVPERLPVLLDAIARINHRLAVLGFTCDPDRATVFFRTQAFLGPGAGLTAGLVGALISTCARTGGRYLSELRLAAGDHRVAVSSAAHA